MDITLSIVTGGGRKQNMMRHAKTLKEIQTWEEAIDMFKPEFKSFFPPQTTLPEIKPKRKVEKPEGMI